MISGGDVPLLISDGGGTRPPVPPVSAPMGLEAQQSPGALWSSKGASLTLNLGSLACSSGQLAVDMGPHLGSGAMASEGAQLTLDLEPQL